MIIFLSSLNCSLYFHRDFEADDDPDWISELQKMIKPMELNKEVPIDNPVSAQKYC